jgi:hypothetical protein
VFGATEMTTGAWVCRLGRRCAADFTALLDQFFRSRSPDQILDIAVPWTGPWLPQGYEQNFGMPLRRGFTQAILCSVTSIDAVQLTPSALDSWRATWVMPSSVIVTVQRVRSPAHLITSPSISSRERWTLPKLS